MLLAQDTRVFQILFCSFSVALPVGFPNPVDQHFDLQRQEHFHWKKKIIWTFSTCYEHVLFKNKQKIQPSQQQQKSYQQKQKTSKQKDMFFGGFFFFAAWHLIQQHLIIRNFIDSQSKQHLIERFLTKRNFMRTSSQNLVWGQIQVSLRGQDHSTSIHGQVQVSSKPLESGSLTAGRPG